MSIKGNVARRIVSALTIFFAMVSIILFAIGPLKGDIIRLANFLMVGVGSQNAYASTLNDSSDFASKIDYQSMDADEQEAYSRMYSAVAEKADSVEFEDQDVDWLFDVFTRMRLDSPELFYVDDCIKVTTHENAIAFVAYTTNTVEFNYLYDNEAIDAIQSRIDSIVEQTRNGIWNGAPESIKASLINDAVISMATYNADVKSDESAHTVVGAMLDGDAVCEGYAQAFTLLARACGLKCATVIGDVPQTMEDPALAHAWNAIMTENGWRYIDSCWNDTTNDPSRYLLMDEAAMDDKGYQPFENNLAEHRSIAD